jgi:4-hydroxythreonine-4-phosphate dehydrogenase
MSEQALPLIGISVGDPGGIGPEITAKALAMPELYEICRPLAIAETELMKNAADFSGLSHQVHLVDDLGGGRYDGKHLNVYDLKNLEGRTIVLRKVSAANGRASYEFVIKVIELAMAGTIDATVTGPINKEAIAAAGIKHAGHTEIFGAATEAKHYAMMLTHENFRVIHVTTHVSLRKACDLIKKDRVYSVIRLADITLKEMGIGSPRIGVCGLNPHAGENGLFGREEIDEIEPAVRQGREEGMKVEGPVPGDTIFSKMAGGQYDIVVVMYHDQGHIPTKLKGFQYDEKTGTFGSISGVNITAGLPIIRVSVDHGTAFDIAGKGIANPDSMIEAIETAALLAGNRS